jgi:ATP/ADP translocase
MTRSSGQRGKGKGIVDGMSPKLGVSGASFECMGIVVQLITVLVISAKAGQGLPSWIGSSRTCDACETRCAILS